MSRPRVYVTRRLPQPALDIIRPIADFTLWDREDVPPAREVLLREVTQVDGLLSLLTDRIDGEVMDAAPRLRVVSNFAVGFDNIDIPAATKRRIVVTNTPEVLTETVADFAFCLMLGAARRLVEGDRYARDGKWKT